MTIPQLFSLALFFIPLVHASLEGPNGNDYDQSCQVVVAGAGIGGAYVAYRLTVDTNTYPAESVCIFEAYPQAGGRMLTVNNVVPGFEDYTVDLGAYR